MPLRYTIIVATDNPVKADAIYKMAKQLGIYVNVCESSHAFVPWVDKKT